jgi:hypothetical protein
MRTRKKTRKRKRTRARTRVGERAGGGEGRTLGARLMVENFTNCHHSCCILFSTLLDKFCLSFDALSIIYAFIIKRWKRHTPAAQSQSFQKRVAGTVSFHSRTPTHALTHTSCCCRMPPQMRRAGRETFPWQAIAQQHWGEIMLAMGGNHAGYGWVLNS